MTMWKPWKTQIVAALVLAIASMSAASAAAVLSFAVSPNPAVSGSTVGVDVTITGVTDLYAYQFSVSFNPSVLNATGAAEGAFLSSAGTTFFDGGTVDNTSGKISFAFDSLLGAIPGASGSGILVHYDFDVLQAGTSALTFSDVIFLDSSLSDITVDARSQVVSAVSSTAVPEPGSLALFGLALAGLAALSEIRRRMQA